MELKERKYFALALVLISGLSILYMLRIYMTPIFAAVVISFLVYPAYKFILKKTGDRKVLSGTIIIISLLLLILIPLSTLSGVMYNQIINLDFSEQRLNDMENTISSLVGVEISLTEGISKLETMIKTQARETLPSFISYTSNFLISMFIMFFIIFYFLIERDLFLKSFKSILPFSNKGSDYLLDESGNIVKAVLIGQVLTAIVQGVLGMISFLIAGIEGEIFWGVIMIVLSLIPVVGAFLVWLPAGLFLIFEGQLGWGIFILVWGALVVSQVDNIVRPYFVNRFYEMHPLQTLIGIFVGLEVFGFIGIIIGPLVLSLFIILVKVYKREYGSKK